MGDDMDSSPFRTMTVGEILDRAFSLYAGNFRLFVGIMAIPAALAAAGGIVTQFFQEPLRQIEEGTPETWSGELFGLVLIFGLGGLVFILAYWIIYSLALGATTNALMSAHGGSPIGFSTAYGSVKDRLIGLMFLPVLVFIVAVGALIIAGLAAALVGGLAWRTSPILGGPLIFALVVGLIVLAMWITLGYSVAYPALVVEKIGILDSMRRSFQLMKGHRLRAFVINLVMLVITFVAVLLLQSPLLVATMAGSLHGGGPPPLWLGILGTLGGSFAGALTGPLQMMGLTLLYIDVRARTESAAPTLAAGLTAPGPPTAPPPPLQP